MAFQFIGMMMVKLSHWKHARKKKGDITIVIEDYSAANNSELTITKGTQVEILDTAPPGEPNWCLVRMINAEDGEPTQGLVPISSLKPIPVLMNAGTNGTEAEETVGVPKEQGSTSPVSKRKTSFKKWLTTPNKKVGQGKPVTEKMERRAACTILEPPRPTEKKVLIGPLGAGKVKDANEPPVKAPLDVDEEPAAPDIPIPPAMEIQGHFPKEPSPADLTSQVPPSLLKTPNADGVAGIDIEGLLKKRPDMNSDCRSDPGQASSESGGENNENDDQEREREKYLHKRRFVLQELIDTEREYVKDLGLVVEGYMELMKENPMPPGNEGKDKIVFGNIHQIYDWHRESFLQEVEKCLDDAERLGSLFTRCERRLHMYVKYCENKPKSEYIVAEYVDTYFEELRQKLGHRLNLPDLLIKPVQRIMKYQLLLRDILKYTERAGEPTESLAKALRVMCVVPKAANDMMQVGRLQGFDGKITAQGNLLLQDTLLVAEVMQNKGEQKFKERRVFLFDQIVIFSEMTQRKGDTNLSNANYIFKNSLKTNKMIMKAPLPNEPLKFMLIDKSPSSDTRFIIQAQSEEVLETWKAKIKSILDMQYSFIDSITKPQQHAKDMGSTPDLVPSSGKDPPLRKTWSQPQPGGKGGNSRIHKKEVPRSPGKEGPTSRSKSVPGQIPKVVENDEQRQQLRADMLTNKLGDSVNESLSEASANKSSLSSMEGSSDFERQNSNSSLGSVSPNLKPRKNVLEGLKYKKSKSDSASGGGKDSNSNSGLENSEQSNILCARTSDAGDLISSRSEEIGAEQSPDNMVHIGKILCDYQAVKEDEISVSRSEIVQVISSNQQNMFMVYRPATAVSPAAEGWIPGHVIGPKEEGNMRKLSWQLFKLRMQGLRPERKTSEPPMGSERKCKTLPRSISDNRDKVSHHDLQYEMSPSVLQPLTSISVQAGDTATLTCRICGRPRPKLTWRHNDSIHVSRGPRADFSFNEDGFASLNIYNVSTADSGEYSCLATSNLGSVITRAHITVLDRPNAPRKPKVRNQVGTSVHLEWAPPPESGIIQGYTIEMREINSDMWQAAIPYVPNTSQVIGDLCPGSTYQFRVSSNNTVGMSEPSIESDFVMIPTEIEMSENDEGMFTMWKSTFENDFKEIDEIGRGRFAVVKKCIQKCSHQDVAAKCLSRRQFEREIVELEFNTLQSLQHQNLVQAFDLYETPTNFIVLTEYFAMGRLFEYICVRPSFDELEAADYISQLLNVTQYLHNCRIVHLDIKPENLLVDGNAMPVRVKLIDFGDARHIYNNHYVHSIMGNPEFLAPEIVNKDPVGVVTDIWSIGVVLYVLLSGVSPFLDESHEETCSNILNNDYCFPDQYFSGISNEARDLVRAMLTNKLSERPTAQLCLESLWIHRAYTPRSSSTRPRAISTGNLRDFIERRKQQGEACVVTPAT